jgi:hypothetical protein
MDPLTIAVSVGSLLAATTTVLRAVNDLRGHYSRGEDTVTAISAECTIIASTLTQIKNLADREPGALKARLEKVDLQNALDCCDVTIVALGDVLRKCMPKSSKSFSAFKGKANFFFNESELKDRLQTLRGLNQAMSGLITAFQA